MRIGINARPLVADRTGIGNYVHGLVRLLPQVAPEHDYFLYSNRETFVEWEGADVRSRIDRWFRAIPGSVWFFGRGREFARLDRLDVLWSTAPVLPMGVPAGILKVITVYDLVWLLYPETMAPYTLFAQRVFAKKAIQNADKIITISRSTGDDLIRILGVPADKIHLVYPGISENYRPRDRVQAAEYISRKYNVPLRYLAVVGTVEPRKNLALLVEVLRILKCSGALDCPLVVAGAKGWRNTPLFQQIESAGLTEREIRFLGYLPDEDLPFFYAGARLFLFPSLYEGFGFPPLEAMASGTPVIASNGRCMPEVLGEAAILLDPRDAVAFATWTARLLSDENLCRSLGEAGIEQARKFRWGSSVKRLLEGFRREAESHGRIALKI